MVHQHYGTQTVNRGAVMPGMLVKHKDGTWTASANLRGRLYLHRGIERTYRRDHFRLLRYKARLGISRPFCYQKSTESTAAG